MKQWVLERSTRLADEKLERELSTTRETTDLVATVDIDGFVLSLNPAGFSMLGLEPDTDLQKLMLSSFYTSQSRQQLTQCDIPNAMQQHVWHSQRSLLSTIGKLIPCSQILVAHKGSSGNIEFFSLIAHDISAIRTAEVERNILQEQLFQSKKMETLGKLAGGIAHDFNNFLTVIIGYAELGLLNMQASEDIRSDLRIILDTAQKATRLTTQLLDYSSKKMIEPQILDLNQVINEAKQLLKSMMGEKVAIIYQLDAQLWPIRFDRSQLEQILFNLAVNARDAMNANGTFLIRTSNNLNHQGKQALLPSSLPGDYVHLIVSDTGCGMSEDIVSQIFEPFFTTKAKGKGTGLGLSAVYGAIKQNHSEVQVKSAPGNGSTFEIVIPAYHQKKHKPGFE